MGKFQDPALEKHGSFWRIRPYVRRLDGKGGTESNRKHIVLGAIRSKRCPDGLTESDARREKQRIMTLINQRSLIVAAQVPFSMLLDDYKALGMGELKSTTAAKYRSFIRKHIEPSLRDLKLADINRRLIQAWVNDLVDGGLEPSSVASIRNCLSAIFTYADKEDIWDGRNPCEGVTVPKRPRDRQPKREKRLITLGELHRFLEALPETKVCRARDARLMVLIACTTTMRVGEILGLQWGDIKDGVATIRRRVARGDVDTPKSEAGAREAWLGALVEELGTPGRPKDWVFHRDGEPLDDRDLQQYVLRPAAERVRIYYPGFGMHAFRRAAVTWRQTIAGATPIEAAKAAGHTNVKMTAVYTLLDRERQEKQAADILAAIRGGRGEKEKPN